MQSIGKIQDIPQPSMPHYFEFAAVFVNLLTSHHVNCPSLSLDMKVTLEILARYGEAGSNLPFSGFHLTAARTT